MLEQLLTAEPDTKAEPDTEAEPQSVEAVGSTEDSPETASHSEPVEADRNVIEGLLGSEDERNG